MNIPHVLNYGMGVESTAILLRWLFDPTSRGFSLKNLIILIAQTGDEFDTTKDLVETHIFPLLRKYKIRTVQVAKAGASQKDGYTILDDSRCPTELYIEGDYKLSDLLHSDGIIPLYSGGHICAQKFKGEVLDAWLADHLGTDKFGPYLGYNSEELKRASKVEDYKCRGNDFLFPLIEWGWTRQDCMNYIQQHLGVEWLKSCCKFCPYISISTVVGRFQLEPEAAGFTLLTEAIALALNPTMQLFSYGRAYDIVKEAGITEALENFEQRLATLDWGLYRVERTWERLISTKGNPYTKIQRRIVRIAAGSRSVMEAHLQVLAQKQGLAVEVSPEANRVYEFKRPEKGSYPAWEGFWVVCPATVRNKVASERKFQEAWDRLTGKIVQLELF